MTETAYTPAEITENRRKYIAALLTETAPQCEGDAFTEDGKRCAIGVGLSAIFGIENIDQYDAAEGDTWTALREALGLKDIALLWRLNDGGVGGYDHATHKYVWDKRHTFPEIAEYLEGLWFS